MSNKRDNYFQVMNGRILITVICQKSAESYDPVNCAPVTKDHRVDCAYYGPLNQRKIVEGFSDKMTSANVESLDISYNKFQDVNFTQFNNLIRLYMKIVEFSNDKLRKSPPKNWFTKLKQLEELDMNGTEFLNTPLSVNWPRSLKVLTLSHMNLADVHGLDVLEHLQELNLNNNHLKFLPKLNTSAPLHTLNLAENPIVRLTVEDIAPFCDLQSFSLQIRDDKSLHNDEYLLNSLPKFSECLQLDQWFTKHFPNLQTGLACQVPPNRDKVSKNITFSESAMKARTDCLARLPATSIFELLLYAIFFSILFPVLYFGNEAYNRYQARQSTPPPTPAKHRRRKTSTTAAPEVDAEAAPSEESEDWVHDEHEHESEA